MSIPGMAFRGRFREDAPRRSFGRLANRRWRTAGGIESTKAKIPCRIAVNIEQPLRHLLTVKLPVSLLLPVALLPLSAFGEDGTIPQKIEYNRDVRPILADNCFKCHGFDKNGRKADLRLDTADGATAADKDGVRAIVPGKLDDSDLHERIHSSDSDDLMPPPKSERKLTARQIAILDRWITQGAEYQPHWAYIAPTKQEPPQAADSHFVKNPIDQFVLAHLQEAKLAHAPEADRPTLCRRLFLDLTGLPPKTSDLDAFVNDRSPDAFEKLVDRLLASPQFGERMAVYWLDLVHYADSAGYHSDNPRNVWPYRDWVIDAFNRNERFDQFTIEQIAGDLLPNATLEQKVASAFTRLNMTTEEGGAQAREYEAKTVTDRVKSIGTAWLAQTIMCAECHDHKYDPITQRDFYSLGAFFSDIKESAIGRREPGMLVPSAEQSAKLAEYDKHLTDLEKQLSAPSEKITASQKAWEQQVVKGPPELAWIPLHPEKTVGDKGSQLVVRADETIKVEVAGSPESDIYRITLKPPHGVTGMKLEVLPSDTLPGHGPGRAGNGNFVLSEFIVEHGGKPVKISNATATFEQPDYPAKKAIDGIDNKHDNGWAVMGNTGKPATAFFQFAAPLPDDAPVTVVMKQTYGENHTIGKFGLFATTEKGPIEAPNASIPHDVLAAVKTEPEQRADEQRAKIATYYRTIAPELAPVHAQLEQTRKERTEYENGIGRCLVAEHTDQFRTVRILPRGNWQDTTGDVVQPAVPHYLPQPADTKERRLTRLDLGKWLVARDNPLTARVFTNRLWRMYFGIGLSKTLEDMGTQGEVPAMQPLLDWLACEFMDSGWDVKHIVRLMVTSGTYRQSSQTSKELLKNDPFNRELARQSRFRIDAEFVRDNALAISGLLVPKIGGPGVKPYQPAGYWENLNFPTREWASDRDENQWRRGLYTWWQRSYLHPSLLAFDAPSREECTAERMRSNIPQQALVLLNDPTFVEAARVFASRIMREGGSDPNQRITWAWRQATARVPCDGEVKTVRELFDKHLAAYTQDPKAAKALVDSGLSPVPSDMNVSELAAWTSVARTILNLHETITRL